MKSMKSVRNPKPASRAQRVLAAALRRQDELVPFGPTFFLTQLAAFVRDRCPSPEERLPNVLVHLSDGEGLDLCHVVGVSVHWVALAVRASPGAPASRGPRPMRTVLVPYSCVVRITMQPESLHATGVGFHQVRAPVPLPPDGKGASAEVMLCAASARSRPSEFRPGTCRKETKP